MVIFCPHCGHRLKLRDAKPGKYKPKCSKCEQRFELVISSDESEPNVRVLSEGRASDAAKTKVEEQTATIQKTAVQSDATILSTGNSAADLAAFNERSTVGDSVDRDGLTGNEATAFEETVPSQSGSMPSRLGGYRVLKELGRGAMGAVYLAKQISLDRLVAMKVIQRRYAKNPTFLSRFTREAYAAAQLVHHNVVQIYDFGTDNQTSFFSMEYVRGQSLAELLERDGAVDPKTAVGYVLQAARGLEFAHNHGMVHRDVKPANLMLNEQGVVKVADLGLVKTPDLESESLDTADTADASGVSLAAAKSGVTMRNAVIGTPNYMAPEQAQNASNVDHRADIYSLGCTLYSLLTGRPPFAGDTVMEVISKHRVEPVVRPDLVVEDVPPELSDVVMRMVAKSPDERYATASELISDLEKFVGVSRSGFQPSEEHVSMLETSVAKFNGSPVGKLRSLVALAFCSAWLLVAVVCTPFSLSLAAGSLMLLIAAVTSYFVIGGSRQQSHLFEKTREFAFHTSWSDRLTVAGAAMLLMAVLLLLGWLPIVIVAALIGVVFGAVFHFVMDKKLSGDRVVAVKPIQQMMKQFRVRGHDESSIRQFVARFAGDVWEEYFESLFGFEAKVDARGFRQDEGLRIGKRFRGWREPILKRLDARLKAQQAAKTRAHLAQVEQDGLQSQGISIVEARAQALRLAAAMVEQSGESVRMRPEEVGSDPAAAAAAKRARIKAMLAEARGGNEPQRHLFRDTIDMWLNRFAGARVRFLIGACLVIGCVLWMRQNDVVSGAELREAASSALQSREIADLKDVKLDVLKATPLNVPIVGQFFNSLNAGIAGGLLIFASLFRGWKMSLLLFPAAVIAMFGASLGLPDVGMLGGSNGVSAIVAIVVAGVGYVFGRTSPR